MGCFFALTEFRVLSLFFLRVIASSLDSPLIGQRKASGIWQSKNAFAVLLSIGFKLSI
uniref:Uncharacterized protein n=1 Tax=Lepeophtheirus salmonis TaxID=72036 RepID=A0A0K2UX74_LEPSM